jgi:hypothetical protein
MAGKVVATFSRSRLSTHEHEGEANEYKDHETRSVLDREPDAFMRQFLPVTHKGPFRRSYGINDSMTCSSKTCTALTAKRRRCWRNSSWSRATGDNDSAVEPSGDDMIGWCLGTGRAFSFQGKMGTLYACSILSAPPLRQASALHNTRHGVLNQHSHMWLARLFSLLEYTSDTGMKTTCAIMVVVLPGMC